MDNPHKPFVQLEKQRLCFYWKTSQQANQFLRVLKAHEFDPSEAFQKLMDSDLPADMVSLASSDKYQSDETKVVRIPHRQLKRLLSLAQYHPFEHEKVLHDLYESASSPIF